MFTRLSIVRATIVVLGLGLLVPIAGPLSAADQGPPVLKADQLTGKQLERQLKILPDTAVIEFKGQRLTKAQMRDMAAQRHREATVRLQAGAREAQATLETFRQEHAKLQGDSAKVMADLARLRQRAAIEQEAAQLFQRSKTASPAERAQIEQRASQLLQQVQKLGR